MKKLFFIFTASMLFVACGQKETQPVDEVTEEVTEEVIFEETTESVETDSTVVE